MRKTKQGARKPAAPRKTSASAKKEIDWETVEREFRAGQLSIRAIAAQAGCVEGAIRKRAKAEGWTRDLSARVRREAQAKLARDLGTPDAGKKPRDKQSDKEIVETAAARQVEVVRQHRHAIGRGRDLALRLIDELEATTTHVGELEEMIEIETASDENPKRREAMHRAISIASRSGSLRDIATAMKNWVALERQAFAIDAKPGEGAGDEPSSAAAEAASLLQRWGEMDALQRARVMSAWVEEQMRRVRSAETQPESSAKPAGK